MDTEIELFQRQVNQLVGQIQAKLYELKRALHRAMVKPLLIPKVDAKRGLRVYEGAEGCICFAFPFTYKLEGVMIKSRGKMEAWKLKEPITKRLWCELMTTILHRNGRNLFTVDRVQLFQDEALSDRFIHFHSLSGTDCTGSYRIPPIESTSQIWSIKQGLEATWRTIHFPDCPRLIPPDPQLKRLGEGLFSGGEKPSIPTLRKRLQKLASLAPPGWTAE